MNGLIAKSAGMRVTMSIMAIMALGTAPALFAQAATSLAPVGFLAGGVWIGKGTWPDGSSLHVAERYFWGPTKRVLHFEAYDLAPKTRTLIYEGILFFDAKRGQIVQWNVKPTGEIDESVVTAVTGMGYEMKGSNTWSLMHNDAANEYRWELRVRQDSVWKTVLNASYQRHSSG